MTLDINEILQKKLEEMEASGEIRERIEKNLENVIWGTVDEVFGGYTLRRTLERQMEMEVNSAAKDFGLAAYGRTVSERVKELLEGALNEELQQKIRKSVDEVLVQKHDGIKLSDLVKAFKKEAREKELVYRTDCRTFFIGLKKTPNGAWTDYKFQFCPESEWDEDHWKSVELRFTSYGQDRSVPVQGCLIGGEPILNTIKTRYLSDFQRLCINLTLNETKVELDWEEALKESHDCAYRARED